MQKTWTPWYTRPWVARLAILGGVVCLLWAVAGCGRGGSVAGPTVEPTAEVETEPAWRQDRGDLLNWFLGHRELAASHAMRIDWQGGPAGGVAWHDKGWGFEKHTWDSQYLYLREDHSTGEVQQFGTTVEGYSFSRGVWMPRRFNGHARGRADGNEITWYSPTCAPVKTYRFEYEWEVSGPAPHDFGDCNTSDPRAACGVQETVTMRYIWGTGNVEIFYYTWAGGWVDWTYEKQGKDQYRWNHVFDAPDGVVGVHEGECSR